MSVSVETETRPNTGREWPNRRIGMIAAAVEVGYKEAIDFAFDGMSDADTSDLVQAVSAYLEREACRTGRWRPWADALWLLPHPWGQAATEFQERLDARVRALAPVATKPAKDPRRSEIAKAALRLLRAGMDVHETVERVRALNATYPKPLPLDVVDETLVWAAERIGGSSHGG